MGSSLNEGALLGPKDSSAPFHRTAHVGGPIKGYPYSPHILKSYGCWPYTEA